ncbi:MAG: RHS repeat-associated core domain-containing protein, partial [Candidatus Caccosoma sp.]|nr:RHS repeat-associated core domain-containing protein [Candidatus Caccosoma sp.]
YDKESNLYYLNSRYYSPIYYRFISIDDIDYLKSESINGINLYTYCGNDPINYADPSGHFAVTIFLSCLVAGALLGGALGGITAISNGQDILTGVLTGAVLGAAVGAVVGIGGVALSGAVSSVLGKTATDLISVAFYGGKFGSWEDYAIAFVFGGLTGSLGSVTGKFAGLAKAWKFAADVALRPAANQLVKTGTRGGAFKVDKYLYDVIIRAVTYGGSNNVIKSNMFGLNLKIDLGKCFYRSTFKSLYSYI